MIKLDTEFLSRMKTLLKDEYDDFLHALEQPDEKAIYVNPTKISPEDFKKIIDFKVTPIDYEKNGFYIDSTKRGRHPLHHAGAFYIQEPSAMFTVNSIQFRGDERILDLCSAPGGKSIQIATRLKDGILVSNEVVRSRANILYSNIERMGLKNVIITNESVEKLTRAYANTFDVVLVDAPCSGEGMFRRGEDVANEWNPNLSKMCATRQLEILSNADIALKSNGILIYSTCTYSKLENEDVIREFLSTHNYELINIDYPFSRGIGMSEAVRLYPHKVKGEGQFVAVLKKKSENEYQPFSNLRLTSDKLANEFIDENLSIHLQAVNFNSRAYIPADLSLIKKNINYLSIGVLVGEKKGNRFEPNHYLFSSYGEDFKRKITLDYACEDAKKYLHGDTISTDLPNGYTAILFSNVAVGGGKIVDKVVKNLYPKGLRNF